MSDEKFKTSTRRSFLAQSTTLATGLALGKTGLLATAPSLLYGAKAHAQSPIGFWIPTITAGQKTTNTVAYSGSATTMTLTFTSNIPVGNTVLLSVHMRSPWTGSGGQTIGTVSGLGVASWTQIAAIAGSSNLTWVAVYSAMCATAGNTISVPITGAGNDAVAGMAQEFIGMMNTADNNVTAIGTTGGSGGAMTAGAVTASSQPEVIFSAASINSLLTVSSGPTNSFTSVGHLSFQGGATTAKITCEAAYYIANTAGSYSTSWTMSANNTWSAIAVSVK